MALTPSGAQRRSNSRFDPLQIISRMRSPASSPARRMEEAQVSPAKARGDALPRKTDPEAKQGEPQAAIGGTAVETTSLVARETRLQEATDQLVPTTPAASTERSVDTIVPQHFSLVSPPQLQPSPRQSPRFIAPGEETHVDEEIAMQAALGKAFQRGVDGFQRNHIAAVSAFDAESPGFGRSRDPSPQPLAGRPRRSPTE